MEKILFPRDLFANVMSVHNKNMQHAHVIEFDWTNLQLCCKKISFIATQEDLCRASKIINQNGAERAEQIHWRMRRRNTPAFSSVIFSPTFEAENLGFFKLTLF